MNKKGVGQGLEILLAFILIVVVLAIGFILFGVTNLTKSESELIISGSNLQLNDIENNQKLLISVLNKKMEGVTVGDIITSRNKDLVEKTLLRISNEFKEINKDYTLNVAYDDFFVSLYGNTLDLAIVIIPDKNGNKITVTLVRFLQEENTIEQILRNLKPGEKFIWEGKEWIFWGEVGYRLEPISAVGCPCGEAIFNLENELVCREDNKKPDFNSECFVTGEQFILGKRPKAVDVFGSNEFKDKVRDIFRNDNLGSKVEDPTGRMFEYWGYYDVSDFGISLKTKEDESYWLKVYEKEKCEKFISCEKLRINEFLGREVDEYYCEEDKEDYDESYSLKRQPLFILKDFGKCFVSSEDLLTGGYR